MTLPPRVRAYVTGVWIFAGAGVLAALLVTGDYGLDEPWLIAAFAGVIVLQHLFETRLVRGREQGESVIHEESVLVAMALLASPLSIVIVFAAGFAAANLLLRRERVKAVFNVANAVAAVSCALLVVHAMGGAGATSVRGVLAALAGAAVYLTVNNVSVSGVLAVAGAGPFREAFLDDVSGRAFVWMGNISIGLMAGLAGATRTWALAFGLAAMLALQFALSAHGRARAERQKLADIVGSSSDGIFSIDRHELLISWNPAMERITGRRSEEVLGRSFTDALEVSEPDSGQGPGLGAPLVAVVDEPAVVRIRSASGEDRWLAVTRSQLPERGWVFVARDFTDSKRAEEALAAHEEQLRQAQKMEAIGRLAGGIAHDFNNLLTTIRGYAQLLIGVYEPEEQRHASVVEIEKAAGRATLLTRQLLAYSRKQMLQQSPLDLNAVILDMDAMLRRMISEDVRLATLLGDDLGRVLADRTQIEQVIMNLCLNARDAMPLGGNLTIETREVDVDGDDVVRPGSYVALSVNDTGSGIDPETQEHIFEPFYTTKKPGEGTGLGLSTVFGIVAQSGGKITVESESGRGTTFTVYLPRVEQPAEEPAGRVSAPAVLGGSETLLVTEDEDGVRELVRTVLEIGGYRVLAAASAREALALAETHRGPIDLVVTDVVMPGMSGVELARRLKATRPAIGILYLSGYTEEEVIRRGLLASSVRFLEKPFTPEALSAKVREILDSVPWEQAVASPPAGR